MPFNSYEFLFVYLPIVCVGFWALIRFVGRQAALGWLTLASLAFYAWASWLGLAFIIASIVIGYVFARALWSVPAEQSGRRRAIFVAAVGADVALLGYLKYENFFISSVNSLFEAGLDPAVLFLPLGLSFLTFQKIAFLADIKAERIPAVSFFDYALFTTFFPRTVSGPIVRYAEIMPQFERIGPRTLIDNLPVALCLFAIGLFKKTVIADDLMEPMGTAFYADPSRITISAWIGALAGLLQLYFDFSGYSDMALGVARLFGVKLPMNFNSPLKASSIVEFWSRWHITLTRFLTDYIYTPLILRLSRIRRLKGKVALRGKRTQWPAIVLLVGLPTLFTMTLSGMWHGAGWTFVVWGVLHGCFLIINQTWRIVRPRFWKDEASHERIMKPVGWLLTFMAVCLANVFFRASSVSHALDIFRGLFGLNGLRFYDAVLLEKVGIDYDVYSGFYQPWQFAGWVALLLVSVLVLPNSLEILRRFEPALDFPDPQRGRFEISNLTVRVAVTAGLVLVIGVMSITGSGAFIYGGF